MAAFKDVSMITTVLHGFISAICAQISGLGPLRYTGSINLGGSLGNGTEICSKSFW